MTKAALQTSWAGTHMRLPATANIAPTRCTLTCPSRFKSAKEKIQRCNQTAISTHSRKYPDLVYYTKAFKAASGRCSSRGVPSLESLVLLSRSEIFIVDTGVV